MKYSPHTLDRGEDLLHRPSLSSRPSLYEGHKGALP